MKPLSDLLKKELFFEWKEEQQRTLEKKLSSIPMLRFLDFIKPFEVHINVNDFVISKVFMQDGHRITFENKMFCGMQLRWQIHQKELYIVVCCLKAW